MDPDNVLFEKHRSRLFGLAYRMLGAPADAEDEARKGTRNYFCLKRNRPLIRY